MTAKTVQGSPDAGRGARLPGIHESCGCRPPQAHAADTFEKYLAYAMALGVEHHWAQAFAGIVKDPPQWYVGPGGTYARDSIRFSSPVRCTAWPPICTRYSSRRPAQVLADPAWAEVEAVEDSPAAASAEAAAARSKCQQEPNFTYTRPRSPAAFSSYKVYCSPALASLPQSALLPHKALLPQRALLPHNALEPHRAFEPQSALLPQSAFEPFIVEAGAPTMN